MLSSTENLVLGILIFNARLVTLLSLNNWNMKNTKYNVCNPVINPKLIGPVTFEYIVMNKIQNMINKKKYFIKLVLYMFVFILYNVIFLPDMFCLSIHIIHLCHILHIYADTSLMEKIWVFS